MTFLGKIAGFIAGITSTVPLIFFNSLTWASLIILALMVLSYPISVSTVLISLSIAAVFEILISYPLCKETALTMFRSTKNDFEFIEISEEFEEKGERSKCTPKITIGDKEFVSIIYWEGYRPPLEINEVKGLVNLTADGEIVREDKLNEKISRIALLWLELYFNSPFPSKNSFLSRITGFNFSNEALQHINEGTAGNVLLRINYFGRAQIRFYSFMNWFTKKNSVFNRFLDEDTVKDIESLNEVVLKQNKLRADKKKEEIEMIDELFHFFYCPKDKGSERILKALNSNSSFSQEEIDLWENRKERWLELSGKLDARIRDIDTINWSNIIEEGIYTGFLYLIKAELSVLRLAVTSIWESQKFVGKKVLLLLNQYIIIQKMGIDLVKLNISWSKEYVDNYEELNNIREASYEKLIRTKTS